MISLAYTMSFFEFKEHLYLYTIGFTFRTYIFFIFFEIIMYNSLIFSKSSFKLLTIYKDLMLKSLKNMFP